MKLAEATPIVAIVALAALEGVALTQGVNGTTLSIVIAAIAGLGGYQVHKALAGRQQAKDLPADEGGKQPLIAPSALVPTSPSLTGGSASARNAGLVSQSPNTPRENRHRNQKEKSSHDIRKSQNHRYPPI